MTLVDLPTAATDYARYRTETIREIMGDHELRKEIVKLAMDHGIALTDIFDPATVSTHQDNYVGASETMQFQEQPTNTAARASNGPERSKWRTDGADPEDLADPFDVLQQRQQQAAEEVGTRAVQLTERDGQ